ncbi:universal stress protein [Gallaecimonas kandeliae]|uniref:universal stress protein n=1 Tax=Gallaecimonas kandeliae TaxID=3029055 RepID=UPI0026491364|nr:universal stress protein [Gallaecimonas kandeliae]WKE66099.1 universal stress protein [Gallaecimonas kandeliae]
MTTEVMACIDGARHSDSICQYAAWSAGQLSAPLTLLHVLDHSHGQHGGDFSGAIGLGAQESLIEEMARLDEQRSKLAMEQGKLMLEAAREQLTGQGLADVSVRQRHGELVASLKELEPQTRLWVLGKHGASEEAEGLGVHVERIVRALSQPVLLAPDSFKAPQSVLIAFDGSATTRKLVEVVARSPLFKGLPCHVVMVGDDSEDHQVQLKWALAQLTLEGHQCQGAVIKGEVDKVLHQYRDENALDLLVMGAYGHSRIRQLLLGSTTTTMLRQSQVPVLLLR